MKHSISLIAAVLFFTSCGATLSRPTTYEDGLYKSEITTEGKSVNNFSQDNGSVYWEKIYDSPDIKYAKDWFLSNFRINSNTESRIIGETLENTLPYSEAGYNVLGITMLFSHPCVVNFTADFKENRYRVIVNKIIWNPQVAVTTYGITQGTGTVSLNSIAVKDGRFKSHFYNKSSEELDKILTYMFTTKESGRMNDNNW